MPAAKQQQTVHERFISGVALCQAHRSFSTNKEVAEFLGINYPSMVKIMDGSQKPTVDQIILLCQKEGLSANWMLLNEGNPYLAQQDQLSDIMKELKALRKDINVPKHN